MKRIGKYLLLLFFAILSFVCKGEDAHASPLFTHIDVTMPAEVQIVFEEDGGTTVSDFYIQNDSNVPIQLQVMYMELLGDWLVVDYEQQIPTDTKMLGMLLDGVALSTGDNFLDTEISSGEKHIFDLQVKHGKWNRSVSRESALRIEFYYNFPHFINFEDEEGGNYYESMVERAGTSVILPIPYRPMYQFDGWEDEEGNRYTFGTYTMPDRDVTFRAVWVKMEAYAVYIEQSQLLAFTRSAEPIQKGMLFIEGEVTDVYTGFEDLETAYYEQEAPWMEHRLDIRRIEFWDVIRPRHTAFWFVEMEYVEYVDVTKLDVSRVGDMMSMFSDCGRKSSQFSIYGLGGWDVSNVERMNSLFRWMGHDATVFYIDDISHWNPKNCWSIRLVFASTAINADWFMDCSGWDVSKATVYEDFNYHTEDKVIPPNFPE